MNPIISVAPMMAWTDTHCRFLHRLCSPSARLFTEMVTTGALLHGKPSRSLRFNPEEHPVALQLGGADPVALARCAKMGASAGFDEINLNVGCPSERVQNACIGAALMKTPQRVAECVSAMRDATDAPVTVKCRMGVDDYDSESFIDTFIGTVGDAGCSTFYIHARIAYLDGLSPAQNRDVPPLNYPGALRLTRIFPEYAFHLNGGITDADLLNAFGDSFAGYMIGRAAYHNPLLLTELHNMLHDTCIDRSADDVFAAYAAYARRCAEQGERLSSLTRCVLGLFNGRPGARHFRRVLSNAARLRQGDTGILDDAYDAMKARAA